MTISTRKAARLRRVALDILQARNTAEMTLYPAFFPHSDKLFQLALRPLPDRLRMRKTGESRVSGPASRRAVRRGQEYGLSYLHVRQIIDTGWWLMSYRHTLGINIDPETIINSVPKYKEN